MPEREAQLVKVKQRSAPMRWMLMLFALTCLVIGGFGIFIPGLPTVPFIILAAWAASLSSPKLHAWIMNHKYFGPRLADWNEGKVSRNSKWIAAISMAVSIVILVWLRGFETFVFVVMGIMAVVLTWLWLKPEPKSPVNNTRENI